MNARQSVHRFWCHAQGRLDVPLLFEEYLREFEVGIPEKTTATELRHLMEHARAHVPYYAELIPSGRLSDPLAALREMPLLTKEAIRRDFSRLQSDDLGSRRWYFNSSGGSTGEPVRLVQDSAYDERYEAIALLFSHLVGRDFGQPEVPPLGLPAGHLAKRAGFGGADSLPSHRYDRGQCIRMTPGAMTDLIKTLNRRPPHLLLAYSQAAYELAVFADRESIPIRPQRAVMTSAGMLHPFMRETMERVFGCRVFNRYGSREAADMACEIPQCDGLWIAPWGVHIEVLDEAGQPVPDGTDGEIVVTLLTNYAMPLLRYRIGDRGALAPPGTGWQGDAARVLLRVTGRTVDAFKSADGARDRWALVRRPSRTIRNGCHTSRSFRETTRTSSYASFGTESSRPRRAPRC